MTAGRAAAWAAVPARWYLGLLFLAACLHKIVAPASFALDVATYDILPLALVNLVAITLPWVELAAGVMLLLGVRVRTAALLVAGMLAVFLVALVVALWRGLDMSCGCFAAQGAVEDPISWLTVVRDLAWLGLALLVLGCDHGLVGLDALVKRSRTSRRAAVLVALALLPAAVEAQTPACDALTGRKLQTARRLLASEHLYDCCDDTIAGCLEARPTCSLAVRLADNVCRRVAAGQDDDRIRRALSRRARSMIGGGAEAVVDLAAAPAVGDTDAPVTVVVYACARCPYCSRLLPALHRAITEGPLHKRARLYLRLFPIRGHEGATEAGLAFLAAAQMGRFWEYLLHDYGHFDEFTTERLVEWAATVGLDREEFASLFAAPATRDALVASKKEGLANGVEETPTFFVNGRRWVGELELEELVDAIGEEAERRRGETWITR